MIPMMTTKTNVKIIMADGIGLYSLLVVVQVVLLFSILQLQLIQTVSAASEAAEGQRQRKLVQRQRKPPNFIIIQPDDHYFFEEWNPPGRFFWSTDTDTDTEKTPRKFSNGLTPNIDYLRYNGIEMTNAYAGK
jgi:hypothetical protein